MFTDIVGFTALTQQDEPLALELLEEHRQKIRPLLSRHHGREVKTVGDGFIVEFSHATEAVQCGVDIQRTFFERNRRFPGRRIDLRVGIHAGEVTPEDDDILGDTVNVASRIVPIAEPGGVCISQSVREEAGGRLAQSCTPLHPAQLKGIILPVRLFRVDLPWRAAHDRDDDIPNLAPSAWDPGLPESPLVGRSAEVDRVQTFVDSIPQGHAGALFLSGDAGVGKSRLGRETRAYAFLRGVRTLAANSTEIHGGVPYAPWQQLLRRVIREEPGERLARLCGPYAADIAKLVPEVVDKLGPPPPTAPGEPAEERLRFFDGVTEFILALSRDQPLLLLVEDLGWADPASLQLLHHLLRNLEGMRVGFLGTYRPVEVPGRTPLGHFLGELDRERLRRTLSLAGLDPAEVGQLAERLLGDGGIVPAFREMIYDRTGGNPFLVEEVVREIVRNGAVARTPSGWDLTPAAGIRVPSSVRSVLEDRLRDFELPTRDLLQTAAVVGQEFDLGLVARAVSMPTEELASRLKLVCNAGLLAEQRRKGGRIVYTFRDRQLRETLYDDLSLAGRRARHLRIARGLEAEFPDESGEHLDELAHHYLEGSDPSKSLEYALRAAERASGVYAHEAAADHLRVALDLLESLPDAELRLVVLERLGSVYAALGDTPRAVQRWKELAESYEARAAPALAGDVYRRIALAFWDSTTDASSFFRYAEAGLRLLRPLPGGPELARLYSELTMGYFWFGRAAEALRMSEEAARLAADLHLVDIEANALLNLATVSSLHEIDSAQRHLARWQELRRVSSPEDHPLVLPFAEYLQVAELQEGLSGDSRVSLRWYDALIETSHAVRFFSQEMVGRFMAAGTGGVDRMRRECDAMLTLHEKYGIPLIDVVEQRLAWRKFYDGDFEGALVDYTAAAAQTAKNAPKYLGLWILAHDQAAMVLDLDRPEEAFGLLQRAKASALEQGLPLILTYSVFDTYLRLLQVGLYLGQEEVASRTYRELSELVAPLNHPLAKAFGAWARALWGAHQHQWPAALAEFDRCIDSWRSLDERVNQARVWRDLASAHEQHGDMAGARGALEAAARVFDEIGAGRHAEMARARLQALPAG